MSDRRVVELRLMMDWDVQMPLWIDDEGFTDADDLGLSERLRAELEAWVDRLEATVPEDVLEDRQDDVPRRAHLCQTLRRLARPSERRAGRAENTAIRREGERLSRLLAEELGDGYAVRFEP